MDAMEQDLDKRPSAHADVEETYARWLAAGARVGFLVLVVSFAIYLLGVLPPSVEPSELPRYWSLPYKEYIAATGAPTGWSWALRLAEGDLLNLLGVAILGALTLVCYLRVLPLFARRGERAFVVIAILEIALLAAAAAGAFV